MRMAPLFLLQRRMYNSGKLLSYPIPVNRAVHGWAWVNQTLFLNHKDAGRHDMLFSLGLLLVSPCKPRVGAGHLWYNMKESSLK